MDRTTEKGVVKKKYSNYLSMPNHPNYYQNPESKKIKYKKGDLVIFCKTDSISKAKTFVEQELIKLYSLNPNKEIKEKKGITNPLLSDLWKNLLDERAPSSEVSTMKGYGSSWDYGIEPFWKDKTVADINQPTVSRYENWYLKNHGERTFFNTRKHLIMLFNYAKIQGYITKVPEVRKLDADVINKKTKKEDVGRVYTDREVDALLKNSVDEKTRIGILIYRYMGPRKNEILKLEWSKVNFKKKQMDIWSFKNKKWRTVPIPGHILDDLKSWRKANVGDRWLFSAPKDRTKYLSSQVFDKAWLKTKVAAGISDATKKNGARIHDLRHTFATQTATDNWPPMVACAVLDMSLKEYQRTYVHIKADDVKSFMDRSFGSLS